MIGLMKFLYAILRNIDHVWAVRIMRHKHRWYGKCNFAFSDEDTYVSYNFFWFTVIVMIRKKREKKEFRINYKSIMVNGVARRDNRGIKIQYIGMNGAVDDISKSAVWYQNIDELVELCDIWNFSPEEIWEMINESENNIIYIKDDAYDGILY